MSEKPLLDKHRCKYFPLWQKACPTYRVQEDDEEYGLCEFTLVRNSKGFCEILIEESNNENI